MDNEFRDPLQIGIPDTPAQLKKGEKEVLDAAWRRWQQGKIREIASEPRFGDAWKLENGIALGEETDRYLPTHRGLTII